MERLKRIGFRDGKQEIIVECKRCDGTGRVIDRVMAACTIGISLIFDLLDPETRDICPRCYGEGFLVIRD